MVSQEVKRLSWRDERCEASQVIEAKGLAERLGVSHYIDWTVRFTKGDIDEMIRDMRERLYQKRIRGDVSYVN